MAEDQVTEVVEPVETVEGDAPEVQVWEDRARRMGWRPSEEYHGPKDRWVDAKTFVDRGETELPVLRERFRKLDDRLAATERELTSTRTTLNAAHSKIQDQSDVLNELRDLTKVSEKRAYQRAMSEIQDRERKAVETADTAAWDRLQMERRDLEETQAPVAPSQPRPQAAAPPPPVTAEQPQISPNEAAVVTQWISDNPWYNSDPELRDEATSLHGALRARMPNQPLRENLDEVRRRITVLFPDKFNGAVRRPSPVATPTAPAPKPKGLTANDLPAEAKTALAKIKREFPGYKDTEYLRLYFGPEAQIAGA